MFRFLFLILFIIPVFAYKIKPGSITVSGISSGAHFASQLHLSYSDKIDGAALIAGGPFYCSYLNITKALYNCMEGLGAIDTNDLINYAYYLSITNNISPIDNLSDDKIFILAGKNDKTVVPKITKSNTDFYQGLNIPKDNIKIVDSLNIGHAFPTEKYGNTCDTPGSSPFMSACHYDGAGNILNFFYKLKYQKVNQIEKNLVRVSQQPYSSISLLLSSASIAENAYLYVPENCKKGNQCKLHISFHGCEMSQSSIGNAYIKNSGFNEWAEANDIIILYPQTIKNYMLGNPHGCWDWWGYTGYNFATKSGIQIILIKKLIEKISDPSFMVK